MKRSEAGSENEYSSEYSMVEESREQDRLNPNSIIEISKVDCTPPFSMMVAIEPEDFQIECPIQSPGS